MGIDSYLVVGGERVFDMKQRLSSGIQVIVGNELSLLVNSVRHNKRFPGNYVIIKFIMICIGTPGRVKHMINDGALDTRRIKILVLDEVDVMLSRGFEEQVKDIFLDLPNKDLQVITVTATLPPEVLRVCTICTL